MPAPIIPPLGDFQLPSLSGSSPSGSSGHGVDGFAKALSGALHNLDGSQAQAAQQAQALASGQAQDLSSVVASVEQANLEVQLAAQIRDRALQAYRDIFDMQV